MTDFHLENVETRKLVNYVISKFVAERQFELQYQTNKRVFLIKNKPLVNTCIDLASRSVRLHGIPDNLLSNEKKYAHLTFWLLKLCPISYVLNPPITTGLAGRVKPNRTPLTVTDEIKHEPVNTKIAYHLFVALFCHNQFDPDEAKAKFDSLINSEYSKEIVKSLRFHNYSARAMAMFLETMMMEKPV